MKKRNFKAFILTQLLSDLYGRCRTRADILLRQWWGLQLFWLRPRCKQLFQQSNHRVPLLRGIPKRDRYVLGRSRSHKIKRYLDAEYSSWYELPSPAEFIPARPFFVLIWNMILLDNFDGNNLPRFFIATFNDFSETAPEKDMSYSPIVSL